MQKEDEVNAHLRDREHDQHDGQHRRPEELVADHVEGGERQPGRERQPDGLGAPECPASGSHVGGGMPIALNGASTTAIRWIEEEIVTRAQRWRPR